MEEEISTKCTAKIVTETDKGEKEYVYKAIFEGRDKDIKIIMSSKDPIDVQQGEPVTFTAFKSQKKIGEFKDKDE